MKNILILLIFSLSGLTLHSQFICEADFTVSTTGENTTGFTQEYVAVNSLGVIIEINTDGIFDGLSAGTYDVYAINYETITSWTAYAVGQLWTAVESEWSTGGYCADTLHTEETACIPYTVCEGSSIDGTADINTITYNHDATHYSDSEYDQLYILLNNPPVNILAISTAPDFNYADYGSQAIVDDADFLIYAINYEAIGTAFTSAYDGTTFGVLDVLDPWTAVLAALSSGMCMDISPPLFTTVLALDNAVCAAATPAEGLVLNGEVLTYSNQLNWYSESEENTAFHIIMRADLSGSFEDVMMIDAIGNSSSTTYYSDFDEAPLKSAYYKIRVEDVDGSVSYSNTILLNRESNSEISFDLIPNPADDMVTINLGNTSSENLVIQIYDAIGKLLYQKNLGFTSELSLIDIDLTSFASGTYNVILQNNTKSLVKRLVKI